MAEPMEATQPTTMAAEGSAPAPPAWNLVARLNARKAESERQIAELQAEIAKIEEILTDPVLTDEVKETVNVLYRILRLL